MKVAPRPKKNKPSHYKLLIFGIPAEKGLKPIKSTRLPNKKFHLGKHQSFKSN